MSIEILDERTIGRLPALTASSSDRAGRYVRALVGEGASTYIENANIEMRALVMDGRVLPLVINSGLDRCAAETCSPLAHYVDYTLEEFGKRHPRVSSRLTDVLARPFAAALESAGIDKVAYVNNWLYSTNPSPDLSSRQIARITDHLAKAYPDCALVFRTVNPRTDDRGSQVLVQHGYRLVRSRRVYLLDPIGGHHLKHRNVVDSLRLLDRTPYEIVGGRDALEPHAERLAWLYRDIYLAKHSPLNSAFNARFIAMTLEEEILVYRALRRDGVIDGFIAWFVQDGVMTGAILGYDRGRPTKVGLLPMLFAIQIRQATESGLLLNLGGGLGAFKMLRGAVPTEEFDAVFDRHLPSRRRLAWAGLSLAAAIAARRIGETR